MGLDIFSKPVTLDRIAKSIERSGADDSSELRAISKHSVLRFGNRLPGFIKNFIARNAKAENARSLVNQAIDKQFSPMMASHVKVHLAKNHNLSNLTVKDFKSLHDTVKNFSSNAASLNDSVTLALTTAGNIKVQDGIKQMDYVETVQFIHDTANALKAGSDETQLNLLQQGVTHLKELQQAAAKSKLQDLSTQTKQTAVDCGAAKVWDGHGEQVLALKSEIPKIATSLLLSVAYAQHTNQIDAGMAGVNQSDKRSSLEKLERDATLYLAKSEQLSLKDISSRLLSTEANQSTMYKVAVNGREVLLGATNRDSKLSFTYYDPLLLAANFDSAKDMSTFVQQIHDSGGTLSAEKIEIGKLEFLRTRWEP